MNFVNADLNPFEFLWTYCQPWTILEIIIVILMLACLLFYPANTHSCNTSGLIAIVFLGCSLLCFSAIPQGLNISAYRLNVRMIETYISHEVVDESVHISYEDISGIKTDKYPIEYKKDVDTATFDCAEGIVYLPVE